MAEKNQNQITDKSGLNSGDFYTVDYGLEGDITLNDITPLPLAEGEKGGKGQKGGKRHKGAKKEELQDAEAEENSEETPPPQPEDETGENKKKKSKFSSRSR